MFNFSCNKICTHSAILLVKNDISNAITSIPTEYEKKKIYYLFYKFCFLVNYYVITCLLDI